MKKRRNLYGHVFRRGLLTGKPLPHDTEEPARPGYYVRLRVRGAEVVRKAPGKKLSDATKFLSSLHEELERRAVGLADEAALEEILFEDFAKTYLEDSKTRHTKTTYDGNRSRLAVLTKGFKGQVLATITRPQVERYLMKRAQEKTKKGTKVSISTRNRDVATLSSVFKRAIALGYAQENPCAGIQRPREDTRPIPYIDLAAQRKLIEKCHASIRDLVLVALDTGMRRGELLALEWRDVDLERRSVLVRRSKNHEPRTVPLTTRATAALTERRQSVTLTLGKPNRVFGNHHITFSGLGTKHYKDALAAAELADMRFHDLRHLFAVNCVRAGVPLPDLQRLLGHKTMEMTLRYSSHSPVDAGARARDLLDAALAAGQVSESASSWAAASASGPGVPSTRRTPTATAG